MPVWIVCIALSLVLFGVFLKLDKKAEKNPDKKYLEKLATITATVATVLFIVGLIITFFTLNF